MLARRALGLGPLLGLLTACGSPPALSRIIEQSAAGTRTLVVDYAEGRAVGLHREEDGKTWAIEIDDARRVTRLDLDGVVIETTYGEGVATETSGGEQPTTYTLDGDHVVRVQAWKADVDVQVNGDEALLRDMGGLNVFHRAIVKQGCAAEVTQTSVDFPREQAVLVTCDGNVSHVEVQPVPSVYDIYRGEGRILVVDGMVRGRALRWTFEYRDDGALGPRFNIGDDFPLGDHFDEAGELSLYPRWLDLSLEAFLPAP